MLRRTIVAALLQAALAAAPAAASDLHAGCDPGRPAVAYRAGQGALSPQPPRAPIPCLAVVEQRTSESATVAVTGSGRVLYAPLVENSYPAPLDDRGPALVAASDDGGASWRALDSGAPDHILDVPPWMARDPATGRVWFASVLPDLCGAEISWSDDDGTSWRTDPVVGCPGMGSMRILEGPPPARGARPAGYPHVVYYCANLSDLSPSNLWCYRSLDGGHSFAFTGSFADPPPRPGCNTEHPARPGAVAPDGKLYFPVYQCGDLSVAISSDEGASWRYVHVATSNVQDLYISSLAADAAGNLYLAWNAAPQGASPPSGARSPSTASEGILGVGTPTLSISRDHGATWSAPMPIAPPRVTAARHIAITAAAPGHVAVSFLASSDGGAHLNGYLAETADALAPGALWWGASLNDPATPLITAADSESFGDRLFNFSDAYAPDGEPWAAFHCAKTSACPGERIGVVGRLAGLPPAAAAPRPGALVVFPPNRRCVTRWALRLRLRGQIVQATVRVTARRPLTLRGARLHAPIVLHRVPRGRFTVRVSLRLADGRTVVATRRYRACTRRRRARFTG